MNSYTIKYGDTLSGIASSTGKSIQELLKLNPSITDPNKIRAGASLNLGGTTTPATSSPTGTTTTQNATTTPAKKTIADVAKITVPDYAVSSEDAQKGALYKSDYESATKTQAQKDAEDQANRQAARARLQGYIDTLTLATQDQIAKFRMGAAKNRAGQGYALAAAGGRIGSATGESEFQNIENTNNAEEQTYKDELSAKIASLYAQSDKDSTAESTAKRAAIQQGAEKYLEFLSGVSSRKQTQVTALVKNMLALGVDPSSLSDADFQKLQNQYGVTKDQVSSLYTDLKTQKASADLETKKTQAELDKNNTFTLNEGDARYTVDPVTGKATLVAARAKTPAAGSGMGGSTTNLNYSDPNYTLNAIKNSKGGRLMTQSELKPITDIQQVVGQAEVLTSLINTVDTGPIVGIVKSNNPYDTKAQEMKAAITAIVPKLARGIYGEVGVLTDSDINNYSKTIANLKSTSDVNKAVMAMTLDIATRSLANQLNTQSAGGRDVSRFESIYTGLNEKANKIKSELGITEQAPATPVDATTQGLRDKYKY